MARTRIFSGTHRAGDAAFIVSVLLLSEATLTEVEEPRKEPAREPDMAAL